MFRAKSFFEKLTGAVQLDEEMENEMMEEDQADVAKHSLEEGEGQLGVDVYQTPTEIIIKTMVAGVKPEDLDVAITRDMVTIKGKREYERGVEDDDYFHKELYWGNFSRTILLPQEVDLEESEAVEKHGLLIIKLSKLDKDRQARLKVKNG
jgi:HSP20 family protein